MTLAALGLGALLCLPCLALIAGVSVAASGAAILTLVSNPFAQAGAALLVIAALVRPGVTSHIGAGALWTGR